MQDYIVSSPSALAALSQQSNLSNSHIRLRILQPLTHKSVFDANRNPSSRFMKCSTGDTEYYAPSKNEYLDLKPLSKAWREVWSSFPTDIGKVTFDLGWNIGDGEVDWGKDGVVKDEEGYTVQLDPRGVILMASTMGSVMYVRSRGRVEMAVEAPKDRAMGEQLKKAVEVVEGAFEAMAKGPGRYMSEPSSTE